MQTWESEEKDSNEKFIMESLNQKKSSPLYKGLHCKLCKFGGQFSVTPHRYMVIWMEKRELLFAQNDERSVAQFHQLGGNEQPGPEADHSTVKQHRGIANTVMKAEIPQCVRQFQQCPGSAHYAERGQSEIPNEQ